MSKLEQTTIPATKPENFQINPSSETVTPQWYSDRDLPESDQLGNVRERTQTFLDSGAPGNICDEEVSFSNKRTAKTKNTMSTDDIPSYSPDRHVTGDVRTSQDQTDSLVPNATESQEMRPENIIAVDERLRVTPCNSQPYRWICYLEITAPNGVKLKGTGSFNTMLGSGRPGLILTCGHNIYLHDHGGYATKIKVYPGRDKNSIPFGHFTVYPRSFRVTDDWKNNRNPVNDFGAIFLTDPSIKPRSLYGLGYRVMVNSELHDRVVTVCGYPGDKADGTLWIAGGRIVRISDDLMFYDNDTAGGQSGSPVWTWDRYNWMVIGIHGYGNDLRNSARRITPQLVKQIFAWSNEIERQSMTAETTVFTGRSRETTV